ncbi:MAG TPA: 3',5'-cyclic-nucleotide phosphodiesterase [Pyrinomonadaceae bacterium]|nr:3',5'-cyclic-nucleotide phosphodiesterase [Pyrinomonadaceae bacterium]
MRIQLLPSTFDAHGVANLEQRLTCFLIDDCVAVDAGSIAIALTNEQRSKIKDIIVTHPHMDHVASLPIFIDDLYPSLQQPMRVHATQEVIHLLERDIFNWNLYPRFSDLKNDYGPVMEYVPIPIGKAFNVAHLTVVAVPVNHIVPTVGLVISDGRKSVAFSSDTAETEQFWTILNEMKDLDALLIEASFPNRMAKLAEVSRHFTPASLGQELKKLTHNGMDIMAVHLKATYRDEIIEQLNALNIPKLKAMEPGRVYEW